MAYLLAPGAPEQRLFVQQDTHDEATENGKDAQVISCHAGKENCTIIDAARLRERFWATLERNSRRNSSGRTTHQQKATYAPISGS